MNWLQFLTSLLETYQDLDNPEVQDIIKEWQTERHAIRFVFTLQITQNYKHTINYFILQKADQADL